jgi:hypothetical protein
MPAAIVPARIVFSPDVLMKAGRSMLHCQHGSLTKQDGYYPQAKKKCE